MDIIKFINSKDIAEHLRKINHQFSPLEAMYLIHVSRNISLDEKHKVYKELIKLYPDCKVEERRSDLKTQTLKEFLQELMIRQNLLIADCKQDGEFAFYYSSYYSKGDKAWIDNYNPFSEVYPTYDRSFNAVLDEDALKVRVTKKYIENNRYIELTLFPDGRVIDVDCYDLDPYIDYFEWMWIDIPTPFKRGDILISIWEQCERRWHSYEEKPFVLDLLDNWDSKKLAENGFSDGKGVGKRDFKAWDRIRQRHREGGDSSDMCYTGYFYDDNLLLDRDTVWTYLDLEYYRGELDDERSILKVMASYLKGNINGEVLMEVYHILAQRNLLNKAEAQLFLSGDEKLLADAGIKMYYGKKIDSTE